mmetsp:Transcript_17377/g.21933  ORF Transcript_17377/g.21933 Transcript_17377/m.21933 type:complete len:195 (-) Transcript_17377:1796-2380(-)
MRGLANAVSMKTYPSAISEKSDAARSASKPKSKSARSARSKSSSRKKAKEELLQQREFKKYATSKKALIAAKYPSEQEIPRRFYELLLRFVEGNGKILHTNLDSLRETKVDPRVGSIIISETRMLRDVVLYSDFCSPKEIEKTYKRIYKLGRADPALAEKASSRKPSHSNIDMYHFFNGLKRNLMSEDGQMNSL